MAKRPNPYYKYFFGFLAGFINCSSLLTLGLFVTHHTGSATRIRSSIGEMKLPPIILFGGLMGRGAKRAPLILFVLGTCR